MSQSIVSEVCDRESGVLKGICTTVELDRPKDFQGAKSPKIKSLCVVAYCLHYEVELADKNGNVVDTISIPSELAVDVINAITEHKSNLSKVR